MRIGNDEMATTEKQEMGMNQKFVRLNPTLSNYIVERTIIDIDIKNLIDQRKVLDKKIKFLKECRWNEGV